MFVLLFIYGVLRCDCFVLCLCLLFAFCWPLCVVVGVKSEVSCSKECGCECDGRADVVPTFDNNHTVTSLSIVPTRESRRRKHESKRIDK